MTSSEAYIAYSKLLLRVRVFYIQGLSVSNLCDRRTEFIEAHRSVCFLVAMDDIYHHRGFVWKRRKAKP